jgi:hypothetical protein
MKIARFAQNREATIERLQPEVDSAIARRCERRSLRMVLNLTGTRILRKGRERRSTAFRINGSGHCRATNGHKRRTPRPWLGLPPPQGYGNHPREALSLRANRVLRAADDPN